MAKKEKCRSQPYAVVCDNCKHSNTFWAFSLNDLLVLMCCECNFLKETGQKWQGKKGAS